MKLYIQNIEIIRECGNETYILTEVYSSKKRALDNSFSEEGLSWMTSNKAYWAQYARECISPAVLDCLEDHETIHKVSVEATYSI